MSLATNRRRLLIVSPHFPPVNAPDMQRVRVSLPRFLEAGWAVTVLTVNDPTPSAPLEPELLATVPTGVRVVRARCCSRRWIRWFGVGNVALRSLPFLFVAGCRLLAGRQHDVVYFSTTMFIVLPFGRIWRRFYGVPYVIDLQDPWVTDFYDRPGAPPPPGGWKYRLTHRLGRWLEHATMQQAAHLITVSAAYGESIRSRHPDLRELPCTELPFGSPDPDLVHLRSTLARRPHLLPSDGFCLAFAGALGPGMLGSVEVLFAAMSALRREGIELSAHFYGTSYAPGEEARPVTLALAARHGVEDCVHESPGRLPYFSALQVTLEARANLLFGSTDLAFTPSKIISVQAAGRPVLALAYANSAMAARLAGLGVAYLPLQPDAPIEAAVPAAVAALRALVAGGGAPVAVPASLSAGACADRQLEIFAAVATGAA